MLNQAANAEMALPAIKPLSQAGSYTLEDGFQRTAINVSMEEAMTRHYMRLKKLED